MANEILTLERLRETVRYEPETGVFTRKIRLAQRHQVGDRADFIITGGHMAGYSRVCIDSHRYLAHRLAWLYVSGEWPSGLIDHINQNRSDNRICNLRLADFSINGQNISRPRSHGRSGYLGASWDQQSGKWRAQITVNGKRTMLGSFENPELAHDAYMRAKREIHPGCIS